MATELPVHEDPTLGSIRRRSQGYLGYLLWVLMILGLLWLANTVVSLLQRWIELLRSIRSAAGFQPPVSGPDFWLLGGLGALVLVAALLLIWAYAAYRTAWTRRLGALWGGDSRHTRILKPRAFASDAVLQSKLDYLHALVKSSGWNAAAMAPSSNDRAGYTAAAAGVLSTIEIDIAHRAVTAGLVIGLNRNPLIDSLTIVATAFELQMHVLTRLGKRPSPGTWMELIKRSTASLFLNSYITREDALYLNLAIRKAALGMEMAADAVQSTLADIDIDEILGQSSIPGLSELTHVASVSMSVGASGIRHIGNFIEHTSNDLLQGVMAGGVLYYHGMALAAECLALDEAHRRSPEMTRTISQAMTMACTPAGRLLRDQVRRMREFLRERRRMVFSVAKENVSGMAGRVRDKVKSVGEKATGLFRQSP